MVDDRLDEISVALVHAVFENIAYAVDGNQRQMIASESDEDVRASAKYRKDGLRAA